MLRPYPIITRLTEHLRTRSLRRRALRRRERRLFEMILRYQRVERRRRLREILARVRVLRQHRWRRRKIASLESVQHAAQRLVDSHERRRRRAARPESAASTEAAEATRRIATHRDQRRIEFLRRARARGFDLLIAVPRRLHRGNDAHLERIL